MDELFAEHNESLIRFIVRKTRLPRDVAEDIAQDTWLSAQKFHGKYDGVRSYRNWLWKFASWKIAYYFRRLQLRRTTSLWDHEGELIEEGLAIEDPPEAAIEKREQHEAVHAAIERLKPREREVIEATALADQLLREVAKKMDLTIWSVERHRKHAQQRLRIMLRQAC